MSVEIEARLARIEAQLDELNRKLEKLGRLLSYLEEMERDGTLPLMLKSIEILSHSFDGLADTKNLRILAMLLSAVEGIAKIDPSLVTMFADSLGSCIAKTQRPEVMRQLKNPPEIGGIFGILKLLGDPDVKKLLGLFYIYAKLLGSCLPKEMEPKLEHLEKLYEARLRMLEQQKQG